MTEVLALLERGTPVNEPAAVSSDVQTILEPEEFSFEWRRVSTPISMIETDGLYLDMTRFLAVQSVSAPQRDPIIVLARQAGRLQLLDGGHRIQVAIAEGRQEIDALVGIHPELQREQRRGSHQRMD